MFETTTQSIICFNQKPPPCTNSSKCQKLQSVGSERNSWVTYRDKQTNGCLEDWNLIEFLYDFKPWMCGNRSNILISGHFLPIFFVWMPFVAMAFQKLVYKHHGCKHWSSSVFAKWCNWITESPCDSDEPSSRQRLVHITTLEPSTSWWKKMSLGWGWMTGGHYITNPNKALL